MVKLLQWPVRAFVTHRSSAGMVGEDAGGDRKEISVDMLDRRTLAVSLYANKDLLNEVIYFTGSRTLGKITPQPGDVGLKQIRLYPCGEAIRWRAHPMRSSTLTHPVGEITMS
jgi:hypothetical protein